jgi:cardiolipin synthase
MTSRDNPNSPGQMSARTAARLAVALPIADMEALAEAASHGADGLQRMRGRAGAQILRAACDELIVAVGAASPSLVSGALLGAAEAVRRDRVGRRVEVVWTGPASTVTSSRLTSAVVVELIDAAAEEIVLVSFATHGQQIRAALDRACERGVLLTLLLERPSDNPRYTGDVDPFPGLKACRMMWPADRRPAGASIHAKIIVVDRKVALVGSANLTGHAMDHNVECGILIHGGAEPAQIRDHLIALLDEGEFTSVHP